MPLLAIDSSSADKPTRSGVEWYAYHLIEAMKRQPLAEDERVVLFSRDTLKWPLPFGWMKARVSWEMLRRRADALLVPAQGVPLFGNVAAVVHDVGFARVPGVYASSDRRRQERELRFALLRAKKVFTVSAFTARELTELYGVSPERMVVAPNAVNGEAYHPVDDATVAAVRQARRVGNHYFLYVGRMDAKKNVSTIIRAFESFKSSRGMGDPYELLLVGSPGFRFEEIRRQVDASRAKASIRYFGYVPENEVAALMTAATAFLFPSWYEGFGVPPLEAAACGAPLIVSDIAAHREICGDAAWYVAPGEMQSWAAAMARATLTDVDRAAMRERGFARARAYSWDATAKIVLDGMRGMV